MCRAALPNSDLRAGAVQKWPCRPERSTGGALECLGAQRLPEDLFFVIPQAVDELYRFPSGQEFNNIGFRQMVWLSSRTGKNQ